MKKKNLFLRSLLIYCLVLILLFGAILFVLNRFLISYEASLPDNTVEEFMATKDKSFWIDGVQQLVDVGFNEFTKSDASISEFGIDENADINWRSGLGNDSMIEYDVRLGSSKICTLNLVPKDDVGFGMKNWQVDSYEFAMPGGSDITISIPVGCTATVNGVEVSNDYISGVGSFTAPLEHSFDIAPSADIYTIKGMLGPAEIKAYSPAGTELQAEPVSSNRVEFLPEPSYGFSFYALSGSEVYVNGTEISGELCSPLDLGLDTGDSILRYECNGLFGDPEIEVVYNDEPISAVAMPIGKCYIPDAGAEIDESMATFLDGFLLAYVNFSANKDFAAQSNFYALSVYLKPNSELYNLTAATIENIAWASAKDIVYNEMDYYDLIPLGDNRYICTVYYDVSYTLGVNDLNIKNDNLVLIEEQNGQYYISAMNVAPD